MERFNNVPMNLLRVYYNRKMQKSNAAVAHSALANKLSRAGYYVMRDQVAFRPEKLFG